MNLRYGFNEYLDIQVLLYTCSFRVKSILFGSSVIVKLWNCFWQVDAKLLFQKTLAPPAENECPKLYQEVHYAKMNLSKYDENATATIFRTLSDLPIFNEKSLKSLLNFNTPEEIAFTGKVIKYFEKYTNFSSIAFRRNCHIVDLELSSRVMIRDLVLGSSQSEPNVEKYFNFWSHLLGFIRGWSFWQLLGNFCLGSMKRF